MGKYSLDAFEQYPLVKLRPPMTAPDEDCYRMLELSQSKLEPEAGELLSPPEIGAGRVILRLNLETDDIADACGFIRRIGSCYAGGKDIAGVVMSAGTDTSTALKQLVAAYRAGFDQAVLLAEPGTELVAVCRTEGISFGLWLELDRGILPLRRSIAQSNLARIWENYPVYIYAGRALTEEELGAARRWHSSGADSMAPLGAKMTLRRMMFPKGLTSGGVLPLRMWWQNVGTAPFYRDVQVRLELRAGLERFVVSIPEEMKCPGLGDTTFNTTARLPQISCGTYELWCGLGTNGKLHSLAMDAPSKDGMYKVGEVTLDDIPRPYLAAMWEEQYADGYYPLEDPAQPE